MLQTSGAALYLLESRVTKFESYRNALLMFQRMMSQVLEHTLNLLIQFESIQRWVAISLCYTVCLKFHWIFIKLPNWFSLQNSQSVQHPQSWQPIFKTRWDICSSSRFASSHTKHCKLYTRGDSLILMKREPAFCNAFLMIEQWYE